MRLASNRWLLVPALGLGVLLLLVMGAALRPLMWSQTPDGADCVRLTDAEIGFAQDMSVHHEQAVFLAQNLDKGADATVVTIAQQVTATQIQEIGTMRGWLMLLEKPLRPEHPMAWTHPVRAGHGSAHAQDGSAPPGTMPGMASWDEINALSRLKGRDAEIRFLQLMIRHHQGGIDMAHNALPLLRSAAIERIAQGMIGDQTQEVGYMIMLLQQRGGSILPYP
ncbi:DUF305 domain-containing protein [Nocardia sp. CDC159]|uniref:DUF305 domain-containing protein n=1 Tax=Nocardia pulmonis TaxID=2951408 RepID=A0A9X2IWT9_9NOCA|nr:MULTISPECIES: DUF305 domain-containing protein [Nocardia]MCM6773125.1 DUF305 domain-containing protein [Nocardia pulmonis]MCM6785572.1 DUF305 domain-containing protein [Nocardia sp. CDC159]